MEVAYQVNCSTAATESLLAGYLQAIQAGQRRLAEQAARWLEPDLKWKPNEVGDPRYHHPHLGTVRIVIRPTFSVLSTVDDTRRVVMLIHYAYVAPR